MWERGRGAVGVGAGGCGSGGGGLWVPSLLVFDVNSVQHLIRVGMTSLVRVDPTQCLLDLQLQLTPLLVQMLAAGSVLIH